jgi:hypothetical protein
MGSRFFARVSGACSILFPGRNAAMASSWAAKLIQYGGKNWGAPTLPDSMGDSFDEGAQGPATIEDVDPDLYL